MPAEIEFTVRLTVMSAKGFRSASRRMGGMQRGVIKLQWLRGVRRHAVAVAVPAATGRLARRVGCRAGARNAHKFCVTEISIM